MSTSGRRRRTGKREAFVTVSLLAALIFSGSFGAAYALTGPKNLALQSPIFYRPVMARVYSFNTWTLSSNETATYAGQAIASLHPSFVSGLIRLEASNSTLISPTAQMLADYSTIRSVILKANPHAKFDIWLRPTQYATSASLTLAIQQTISQLPVDVVSFDNYDTLSQGYQQAIVTTVHSSGKLVDGDVNSQTFSAGNIYVKPDIFTTADYNWTLGHSMSHIISYANSNGIPAMLHINNGPIPVDSFGQTEHYNWNFVWTDQQRTQFLTQMAQAQKTSGSAFMYPVSWPGGTVSPPTYWDSPHDGSMLQLMVTLSGQYNPHPKPLR